MMNNRNKLDYPQAAFRMVTRTFKRLLLNTFWLSVLLHLLLLALFSIFFFLPKEDKKKTPHLFVPSYLYKMTAATLQRQSAAKATVSTYKKENRTPQAQDFSKPQETFKAPVIAHSRYAKSDEKKAAATPSKIRHQPQHKSMLMATQAFLKQSMHHSITAPQDEDPIYLVGDNNAISDPLIILMGKALSAHFEYPRMAGEFGIKGRVLVRLTLHPEGFFSHVQILQSSNNRDLDAAALYAINAAPTVYGVDRFLSSPKNFVVGFIFR